MKNRSTALWLVVAGLLVGCSSKSDMPTTGELLTGARESLAEGDDVAAQTWLESAGARIENDEQQEDYQLLTAELYLKRGQPQYALQGMEPVLDREPDNPRAHEVAGKAQLQLGEFEEASRHFTFSKKLYRDGDDVQRATNLLALSRGFEAYADGRPEDARTQWDSIADDELRESVLGATSDDDGDEEGTFAQFYLPRE